MQESLHPTEILLAPVPEDLEHIRAAIKRRGIAIQLARIAPEHPSKPGSVHLHFEWLVTDQTSASMKLRQQVWDSLNFLLSLEPSPDFWSYLIYHTTTASNLYSGEGGGVYWERIPLNSARGGSR